LLLWAALGGRDAHISPVYPATHLLSALEHPPLLRDLRIPLSRHIAEKLDVTRSTRQTRQRTESLPFPCLRPRSCNRHLQPVVAFPGRRALTSERPGPPRHPAGRLSGHHESLSWIGTLAHPPYQRAHPLVPPTTPAPLFCVSLSMLPIAPIGPPTHCPHAARPESIVGVSTARAAAIQNHHGSPAAASLAPEISPSSSSWTQYHPTLPLLPFDLPTPADVCAVLLP
jgi:hypothetical protein